jgi:hypothetical protein
MPSKGITSYGYVASSTFSTAQLMVLVPSANYDWFVCSQGVKQVFGNWTVNPFQLPSGNAQINLSDICYDIPDTPGTVTFQTLNIPGFSFQTQIYPISGEIGYSTAINFLSTPAVITPEFSISWGLYRAGPGDFGLTDQYQQYMYLTDNHSQWMGNLVNINQSVYGNMAFSRFVLPGAHDAGMFDPTWILSNLNAINNSMSEILTVIMGPIFSGLVSDIISAITNYVPRFIEYAAFTQKENVTTMLNLGVRYFDFRPGKVAQTIQQYLPVPDNTLYHQHSCIPGCPYIQFLADVLGWLGNNPSEIVVISLSTNGFYDDASMDPTLAELEDAWNQAVNMTQSDIIIGDSADLGSSYNTLLAAKKRVLFLNNSNIGGNYHYASKYDTYDDANYGTFTPDTIINNVLVNMTPQDQVGNDYTVVQVQGTCTEPLLANLKNTWTASGQACVAGIAELVATCIDSEAASFLMSTKPLFDQATYPWIYQNLNNHLGNDQLIVVLNDFADNALADVCKALTLTHFQAS